jgi:ATP-dependent protease ClpP protease subunit
MVVNQINNEEQKFQIELFKERLKKREIWINGQIDIDIVERLYINLLKLQEDSEINPITVVVNSRGGLMYESAVATDLMGTMANHCKTIALASAMSGGFSIFMGGKERVCHDNTCLLAHDAAFSIGNYDKASNIRDDTDYIKYRQEKEARFFSIQTGGRTTPGYWMELFLSGKDKYFSIEEALDLNIVHKVIRRKELASEHRKPFTWDINNFIMAQQ